MKLKTLKKRLLIAALIMSAFLNPTATRAEDACSPVVKACDRALADQDKVIDLKGKLITAQDNIIKAQDTRIVELEKQNNNIFKSPMFYVVIGLVVGGFAVSRAR